MKKLLDLAQHSWIQSESLTDLQLVVFMLIKLICPTSSTVQLIKHKAFIYYINIVKKKCAHHAKPNFKMFEKTRLCPFQADSQSPLCDPVTLSQRLNTAWPSDCHGRFN